MGLADRQMGRSSGRRWSPPQWRRWNFHIARVLDQGVAERGARDRVVLADEFAPEAFGGGARGFGVGEFGRRARHRNLADCSGVTQEFFELRVESGYALVSLVRATVGVEDFFIIRSRLAGILRIS